MILRNISSSLVRRLRLIRSFSSEPLTQTFAKAAPLEIEKYRAIQLDRLQALKPSDFTPAALGQLIADFLVSPKKPDTVIAGNLLDKFLFKTPEIDEKGDLSSLYILQLSQERESSTAAQFLIRLLREDTCKVPVTEFMLECAWKSLIDTKCDSSAFELLKACVETSREIARNFVTREFKDQLILNLFLPSLNWDAINFIVKESVENNQITVQSDILQEIFHVMLDPLPNDRYFDPIETEPFSADIVNLRFHRLIQNLQSWKDEGIPIKGVQISKALEAIFKQFLPTESMMDQLQKLI